MDSSPDDLIKTSLRRNVGRLTEGKGTALKVSSDFSKCKLVDGREVQACSTGLQGL